MKSNSANTRSFEFHRKQLNKDKNDRNEIESKHNFMQRQKLTQIALNHRSKEQSRFMIRLNKEISKKFSKNEENEKIWKKLIDSRTKLTQLSFESDDS
jgi:hypothetical protein